MSLCETLIIPPTSTEYLFPLNNTGCKSKVIAPSTLYTKNGIFYFCNRSNRLIYRCMLDR